ncbi:hypothetical protein DL93DRAFT_2098268 [Clavulina sp. PMI_390]|nr:hypothetical protein DL93DRAFT_2098268 [Clavulina sp. PMI_390]
MGASASHPTDNDAVLPPVRALHVLRVTPGSPASHTDIEPFFDFVVSVDQGLLGEDGKGMTVQNLERVVEAHEGAPLPLIIWSSKTQTYRQSVITPSRTWAFGSSNGQTTHSRTNSGMASSHSRAGSLDESRKPSLLGLSMRICEPAIALDNVWHILEVLEGSPAESAGLVPFGDWIIGWSGGVLRGENDFFDVVEAHVEKPLRVYVYSYDFDTLREVVLVPNRMWGGEGLLGCGVGFGLLHRIPKIREQPLFSSEEDFIQSAPYDATGFGQDTYDDMQEQELFVPADDIYDDETPAEPYDQPFVGQPPSQYPHNTTHSHPPAHLASEDVPKILSGLPQPPLSNLAPQNVREEQDATPSPPSTPTQTTQTSSPSLHESDLVSEASHPPSNGVAHQPPAPQQQSFQPLQPQPRRPSGAIGLNSFRTFSPTAPGWGGANRFVGTPPRRSTPTQFSPQIRPQIPTDSVEDDSDEDEDEDERINRRARSPTSSLTSVDD